MQKNKESKSKNTTENVVKDNIQEMLKDSDLLKQNYFKNLSTFVLTFLILISSTVFAYYSYFLYTPPVNFIALDKEHRVLEEVPLNLDVMPEEQLNQWANEAISEIFSYNYLTFDKHGGKIKHLFLIGNSETTNQYKIFMELFNNLRLQKKVEVQKAIVDPVILNAIKVENTGTIPTDEGSAKAYLMEGVILLNIHGKDGLERIKYNVKVILARTTFKKNKNGVAIQKIQLT